MVIHTDPSDRNRAKAKALLAALVQELCRDGAKPGRSEIYKGFYAAHLIHARDRGVILSDWPIVKMTHGPGVDRGKHILEELAADNAISQSQVPKGSRLGYEYAIGPDQRALAQFADNLSPEELKSVEAACAAVRGASGEALESWTHEFSRAWKAAENGHELAIYADLLEDEDSDELADKLRDVAYHLKDVFEK